MRHAERHGFMLILAILAIALVAAAMLILAGLANSLLFDANQAHLQACNRNLAASALAWAQQNRDKLSSSSPAGQIQLDITHLNVPHGSLHVTVLDTRRRNVRLQISTECRREATKSLHSDTYLLESR